MKVLVQRVSESRVTVAGEQIGAIGRGVLALVGIECADDDAVVERMVRKLIGLRLFADDQGKMNLDLRDVSGAVLAVSQFTLAADTSRGRRPGFSRAAGPEEGLRLYQRFVASLRQEGVTVATGRFGADMQVSLINDGPVTFMLEL